MEKDSALRTPHSELLIRVEMGEGVVSKAPNIITTVGCGSCVVVVLYDAKRKIGGLAHVMLPSAECEMRNAELKQEIITPKSVFRNPHSMHSSFEFAPTALPALLEEMLKKGCSRRNIVAKIAGGARMFSTYAEFQVGIGEQNVKSVRQLLERERIPLMGVDVGGKHGRSVEFHLDSGMVVVKAFGREDREI